MCEPDSEDLIPTTRRMNSCYDDLTWEWLDPQLVHARYQEEMKRFEQMGVCKRVPREEALRDLDMKLTGVRWVKVNKGTKEPPNVRCILGAQEDATNKEDDLFAGTPPCLARRLLLSDVVSVEPGSKIVMSMDIRCAFLHGAAG